MATIDARTGRQREWGYTPPIKPTVTKTKVTDRFGRVTQAAGNFTGEEINRGAGTFRVAPAKQKAAPAKKKEPQKKKKPVSKASGPRKSFAQMRAESLKKAKQEKVGMGKKFL